MRELFCDLETFSETPINCGTHRYSENAEVLLWLYAIDDGAPKCWDVTTGKLMPADLKAALNNKEVKTIWHNGGMFDCVVLPRAMGINLPIERVHDTMVQALSHSLPGGLGILCEILGVDADLAKDKEGKQLIHLFCKPRPANSKVRRATRETHPVEWARFIEYGLKDITSMREVYRKLPMWNYKGKELELWHLDQKINRRGVAIDLELAQAAIEAVNKAQKELASRTMELTDNQVSSATQRDALLKHLLLFYGVDLPDMTKATLERRIEDPSIPWALRELLSIRLQASTSSTSKYKTLIKAVSSDGRIRGILQFNGASRTGRWAGRLFQPQNLPRPTLKQEIIDAGIDAMKAGCADLITNNVMELTSSAIRGCIIAPPGKKLCISDLSNIEGRVQSWLADETWKLRAFREYDAGTGHDLYKLAYAKSFGIRPEDVTKDQRQVGKVQELALGYEGGVGAFLTFAAAYNIDLEQMADQAFDAIPADILREAEGMLKWTKKQRRSTFGLSDKAWIVCESFKRSWRAAHANIASYWTELADTIRAAIRKPGVTYTCRLLKIRRDGSWLRIGLPSGRCLCYPSPAVAENGQISYMGKNQYSNKWHRINSYGGKFFENVCQAVARDVMTNNMPAIEDTGYEILLTVHDEAITETPDAPDYTADKLSAMLSANPDWAPGLPLAAAGFETYAYKKD